MNYLRKLTIKDWMVSDRPREKLMLQGRRNLSDAELLAILIGSGSRDENAVDLCRRILHQMDDDLDKVAQLSINELCRFKGIGEAKAITIISAMELCYRRANAQKREVAEITSSKDIFELMQRYFSSLQQEEFWIIMLNRGKKLIGTHQISKGGLSETIADPKVIFPIVLDNYASFVILAHNHPSQNLTPSDDDIRLTNKLIAASKMLNIEILDHLIFGEKDYLSFVDEGLM